MKISTSSSVRPAANRCSASLHVASYSSARATFAKGTIFDWRAAISKAADAPFGLRIAVTMMFVSSTNLTSQVISYHFLQRKLDSAVGLFDFLVLLPFLPPSRNLHREHPGIADRHVDARDHCGDE